MTPDMVLRVAAFKGFLQGIIEGKMYYGPLLGWAWIRGSTFKLVGADGYSDFLVPRFEPDEYERTGQASMLQKSTKFSDCKLSLHLKCRCTRMAWMPSSTCAVSTASRCIGVGFSFFGACDQYTMCDMPVLETKPLNHAHAQASGAAQGLLRQQPALTV